MIKSIINDCYLPVTAYIGNEQVWQHVFTPLDLFFRDKQGVWFDPSDLSTMFQDVSGTVPVTKDGDPVGMIKDKSGNDNHAIQEIASARPIYRTDGELHWLEFDGVDDYLTSTLASIKQPYTIVTAKDESMIFGQNMYYISSSSPTTVVFRYATNYYKWTVDGSGGIATKLQSPEKCVMLVNIDGSNSLIRFNNTIYSKSLATTALAGETHIFKYFGGKSSKKALMYGFIIAQNIVGSKVDMICSYLANKSGVTL